MNWIQGLLITSIIALLVYLLRSRRSAQSKAWVKVGYLVFVLGGVYAVLRPNDTAKRTPANSTGVNTSRQAPATCTPRLSPRKKSSGTRALRANVASRPT